MRTAAIFFFLILIFGSIRGQEGGDNIHVFFNPYTSLRTHFAVLDKEAEFQDNASRLGLQLRAGKNSSLRFIGHVELSIRLIESTNVLNADSRTTSGFIILNNSQERQVFGARLGYLGVDMGAYGAITIGKQWSTYYDISGMTDRFNVFGGTTANTYAGGTDGSIGTGRSEQAFLYRVASGKWRFGIQLLFNSLSNNTFIDGYGGSVRYDLFPGFTLGAAYQHSLLPNSLIEGTLGLEGDPEYYCFGVSYEKERFSASAVYAIQSNGDLTLGLLDNDERPSVVYGDTGFELAVSYRVNKWRFLGGVNMEWAETERLPIASDYHTENYLLGAEYHPNKLAYFYSELRLDQGVNALGVNTPDVFTFGLRIDLSHEGQKTFTF